jgi:hypothetical protein
LPSQLEHLDFPPPLTKGVLEKEYFPSHSSPGCTGLVPRLVDAPPPPHDDWSALPMESRLSFDTVLPSCEPLPLLEEDEDVPLITVSRKENDERVDPSFSTPGSASAEGSVSATPCWASSPRNKRRRRASSCYVITIAMITALFHKIKAYHQEEEEEEGGRFPPLLR